MRDIATIGENKPVGSSAIRVVDCAGDIMLVQGNDRVYLTPVVNAPS
jgi:hypothetical protein